MRCSDLPFEHSLCVTSDEQKNCPKSMENGNYRFDLDHSIPQVNCANWVKQVRKIRQHSVRKISLEDVIMIAIQQMLVTQRDAVESSQILEYDFYKVGYRISGEKIAIADSTTIKYYADVNDDGTADTISYYVGTTAEMSSTMNPSDKPLYRIQNSEPPYISSVVTEFRLAYVDSAGNQFSYDSLNIASQRARIRGIETTVEFESGYPIDGAYQAVQLVRSISPRNL